MDTEKIQILVSPETGEVSGIFSKPDNPMACLVLAHGAGAGMEHPFMKRVAAMMAEKGIAVLRYQFPYMEAGKKRPDRPAVATNTVKAAVDVAARWAKSRSVPLFAGGKSFGGRMTSQASEDNKIKTQGIIFFGFPLHAPGKPSNHRAEHLFSVNCPMLFLQGSRDALADLEYLNPVVRKLGNSANIEVLEGADHSFKTRKKDNLTEDEVYDWLVENSMKFMDNIITYH